MQWGCYRLLPECCNLSCFSQVYPWAMDLVAGYVRKPLCMHRIRNVSNCSVLHGHKQTSFIISLALFPFSEQPLGILQQDSLLPGTVLPTCLERCCPHTEGKYPWKFVTWTEAPSQQEGSLLTCKILHLSERQSISSHGWYIPRVTQFNKITIMLTHSNQVEKSQGKLL